MSDRNGDPTPIKAGDPRYLEGVSEIDDDMTDAEWSETYGPARHESVPLLLWQVSIIWHGGKQVTFYLDGGVQGIPNQTAALQWVADNMPEHRAVAVMAIHYNVCKPAPVECGHNNQSLTEDRLVKCDDCGRVL